MFITAWSRLPGSTFFDLFNERGFNHGETSRKKLAAFVTDEV